jgi:peroxiredoxin
MLLLLPLTVLGGDLKSVTAGDSAPLFTLKNYDGKTFDLKTILKERKFAVVMFIATECPVSNAYNERMEKLYETYDSTGVAILGINSNKAEDVARITAHAKEHGFRFPVLKDEKNTVADLYGAQVTPETYLITPAGKILYHGRIDDNRKGDNIQSRELADAINAALAGKPVPKTEAKAVGCSIKRLGTD